MPTKVTDRAKLYAIEGIDGSGKGTCTQSVAAILRDAGYVVATFSFPQYASTICGKRLGVLLNNPAVFERLLPFEKALLFAMDRRESLVSLTEQLNYNNIVLLDRYVPSNMVYATAAANLADTQGLEFDSARFAKAIADLEYVHLSLPRPDGVFVLDMPVNFAVKHIAAKMQRVYTDAPFDANEANVELLCECYRLFRSQLNSWHDAVSVVPCVKPDGTLRDPGVIATCIASQIKRDDRP